MSPDNQCSSLVQTGWIARSRLWLVLDYFACQPFGFEETTVQCLEAGVDAVVFRHKHGPFSNVVEDALRVREHCAKAKVPFVLAHELDKIELLCPDAVHLGSDLVSGSLDRLKSGYPNVSAWGVSTHSCAEAAQRAGEGFDYCFLGPVFETRSKQAFGKPLGASEVQKAQRNKAASFQVIAIGGIQAGNICDLLQAGLTHFAVIGAIQNGSRPYVQAAALRRLLPQLASNCPTSL